MIRVIADREDPKQVRLGDIATRSLITASPDMSMSDARDLMAEHRVHRLPVVKDERIVGILSLGDVALADASKRTVGDALENVSESPSTLDLDADAPERGTPERVQANRDDSA